MPTISPSEVLIFSDASMPAAAPTATNPAVSSLRRLMFSSDMLSPFCGGAQAPPNSPSGPPLIAAPAISLIRRYTKRCQLYFDTIIVSVEAAVAQVKTQNTLAR